MVIRVIRIECILFIGLLFAACGSNRSKSNDITGTTEKVVRIVDGNTLELESGLCVDLIGIEPTVLSKDWLGEHIKGQVVILTADSDDPKQTYSSSMETVRAYVKIKEDSRGSINGMLLRLRKSKLSFDYCRDSLDVFKRKRERPVLSDTELFSHLRPATFYIEILNGERSKSGTGFYINETGLALTNNHVLSGYEGNIRIYYYDQNGNIDRENYRRLDQIVETWRPDNGIFDVTLFTVKLEEGERTPYLPLINQREILGAKLAKLGNPTGKTCIFQTGNLSKYDENTGGVVHSCPSNPGDSGGPVVNTRGEVVGINQSAVVDASLGTLSLAHGIVNAVDILPLKKYMEGKGIEYGQ